MTHAEDHGRPLPELPPSPEPPRPPRAWLIAIVVLAVLLGVVVGVIAGPAARARLTGDAQSASPAGEHAPAEFYTCGMHPWVILPEPGLCPICHMDLTPLDPGKFTGKITIDPVVTQNIGVRVRPVTTGPVVRTIRTVATVAYDETRVRDVNIKTSGWIESLHVDYEGAEVAAGDPLFEFYSPKLYAAQSEYLNALAMRDTGGSRIDAERLIDDARAQLEYLDVTPEQIAALEASGEPAKTVTMLSPHTGVVTAKHANEGMRVEPGMRVYQIADLSKVWAIASLYEYQLPFVQEGQPAVMSLPYIPGQEFEGRVSYIYPYLDEKARQIRVRLEFDNAVGLLRPGMYADIELRSTLARDRTLAPRSAVIDTGERQIAFVSLGEGRFEPREVRMGAATDDGRVEILDGLRPGEMVVTSGQFLLDSEARVRESLAKMIRGDLASEQEAVVDVAGESAVTGLPPAMAEQLDAMLRAYMKIGDLLAGDTVSGVAEPARAVAEAVDRLLEQQIPGHPHFWHEHDEVATVRGRALEIAGGGGIAGSRLAFADLSVALSKLVRATGVPPVFGEEVQELHCPMYRSDQGGSIWLQPAGDVRNPFYGSVMLGCYDKREALPVTGSAP